ncbi:MAG TPA: hypothetical protein VGE21_04765 [Flavobacteriales bacterium]
MIKLFSLLNLTGLYLFNLLFVADVNITHDAPTTMAPGSEVKVTVSVDKQQVTGFAKLQIELPAGLNASAIETKGASFTFAEGKAKFIWMALPSQPEFKVSFTLSASATATGSLPITGKFSYIEDNERKVKDLVPTSVNITGAAMAAQDAPAAPAIHTTPANHDDVVSAGGAAPIVVFNGSPVYPAVDQASASNIPMVPMQQGAGNVGGKRTITVTSATEATVQVSVDKGSIRGFGKLQETIPAGFTAVEVTSDEAIFTAQDRFVKFVWLNLPAKNTLTVTYKLRSNGLPEAEYPVNGEFGYLLNDETQKAVVGTTVVKMGLPTATPVVAQVEPVKPTAQPNTATPPVTASNNTKPAEPKAQPKTEPVTAQAAKPKPASRIPSPETGITYKVQITAAHREVGSPYFQKRHRYSGDFTIERHEGWIKYVTGRFDQYTAARDQRKSYVDGGHNFPGPFVTAYNNGERITVQEALMISNQRAAQ